MLRSAMFGLVVLALLVFLQLGPGGTVADVQARDLGATAAHSMAAKPKPKPPRELDGYYLSTGEIAAIKRNIGRYRWAAIAWQNTKQRADEALGAEPQPADPNRDYSLDGASDCSQTTDIGWRCGLYAPGLTDGRSVLALAQAYAITGDRPYAEKAKEFLLAWARTYNPPAAHVGHFVAEPVGFMIKGFLAYDLVRRVFSAAERAEFGRWALQFVRRGMTNADIARDFPWIPEAPYGNGAAWPRAMAVLAAAAAGEPYLSKTLRWNWQHTTRGGREYGWANLLDGAMGTDGKMVEERVRQSVPYGLYTWYPLELIADVAYHAGFGHDLFRFATPSGKSLRLVAEHYAPYLTGKLPNPYGSTSDSSYQGSMGEYRAAYELIAKRIPESKVLRAVVRYGGSGMRGENLDGHISAWNALVGSP